MTSSAARGAAPTEQLSLPFRIETQVSAVADEVSALIAVIRPILLGTLFALKEDVVAEVGGYQNVKLKILPRLYRRGDGDCGICFEYAVHDALNRAEPSVLDRISDALTNHCRLPGSDPASILFGVEKDGTQQLIETASGVLTDDSLLLYGRRGRPAKLKRHLAALAGAFRRPTARAELPQSISGLWKADLFLGTSDADKWVGSSVKINPSHLEGAPGLRIGVIPTRAGRSDAVRRDDSKNLVICPLPHDGEFMEIFYRGWVIVQMLVAADAQMPGEVDLPQPVERQVARTLVDRREFPVVEVVRALEALAQPELLDTSEHQAAIQERGTGGKVETGAVVAPRARDTTEATIGVAYR